MWVRAAPLGICVASDRLHRPRLCTDQGENVPPIFVLGDHHRDDHAWNRDGQLRRSLARSWLSGWRCHRLRAAPRQPRDLVPGRRKRVNSKHRPIEGRVLLLDHDLVFADARHRALRLGGWFRPRRPGPRVRIWCIVIFAAALIVVATLLLLDENFAHDAVLGGIHPDMTLERDSG